MKFKRIAFLALSALFSIGATFALNTKTKSNAVKNEFKKDTQKQLVLSSTADYFINNSDVGQQHYSHSSHSSHASHSSHSSHYSSW